MVSASQVAGEWQVHKVYSNYEIHTIILMIRNMKTQYTLSIYTNKNSYKLVQIDRHTECYHRVIALHFIPNPDPEHLTEVNHNNQISNDNRIKNLEWVTPSANRKDRQPYTLSKKRYTKELPDGSILITQYKGFTSKDYYYAPNTKAILKKVKDRFQYLTIKDYSTGEQFSLFDTNQVQHLFSHSKFTRTFQP